MRPKSFDVAGRFREHRIQARAARLRASHCGHLAALTAQERERMALRAEEERWRQIALSHEALMRSLTEP